MSAAFWCAALVFLLGVSAGYAIDESSTCQSNECIADVTPGMSSTGYVVGESVEYYSSTHNGWIPAEVRAIVDSEYELDVKPGATVGAGKLRSRLEGLMEAFQQQRGSQGGEYAHKCGRSACSGRHQIYRDPKYQLIEKTGVFTSELLDRVANKLNYKRIRNGDYIVKDVKSDNETIVFLGDFHSSLDAFEHTLVALQFLGILDKNFKVQPGFSLMYMGDLVDRGPYGLEILAELALLVDLNQEGKVQCLKGNHEERDTYNRYGFGAEVEDSPLPSDVKVKIHQILDGLPRAVYMRSNGQIGDGWYQFAHGGFSKSMMWSPDDDSVKEFLKGSSIQTLEIQLSYPDGFSWGDFSQANPHPVCEMGHGGRPECGPQATTAIMDRHNIIASFGGHQHFISNGYMLKDGNRAKSFSLKADAPGTFYESANFFTASDSMITLPASQIGKVILSSATETPGIGDALKLYEYNRPIGILKLQTGRVGIGFQRVEGQSPQISLDRLKRWIIEPQQSSSVNFS